MERQICISLTIIQTNNFKIGLIQSQEECNIQVNTKLRSGNIFTEASSPSYCFKRKKWMSYKWKYQHQLILLMWKWRLNVFHGCKTNGCFFINVKPFWYADSTNKIQMDLKSTNKQWFQFTCLQKLENASWFTIPLQSNMSTFAEKDMGRWNGRKPF